MNACILLCVFAMAIMCQAYPSSLELSSLDSLNRRLQNPLLHHFLSNSNQGQVDHHQVTRQGKVNLPVPHDLQHLRRFGYVPAYGVGGIGAGVGVGAGAGLNAGLSAGLDAGLDAGLSAGIGGNIGAGVGGYGYGYGGLGYPVYG